PPPRRESRTCIAELAMRVIRRDPSGRPARATRAPPQRPVPASDSRREPGNVGAGGQHLAGRFNPFHLLTSGITLCCRRTSALAAGMLAREETEFKWGVQTQRILMKYTRDSYSSGRFTFDGSITKNVIA